MASSHGEPFEGSADALIRERTGSDLARGNYVCSILVHFGLLVYAMHGNQKGVQVSPGSGLVPAAKTVPTGSTPSRKPHPSNRDAKIAALLEGFQKYLDYFTINLKFSGPSIYFHLRTIEAVRGCPNYGQLLTDTSFCEYVYATLASWGMHRMGKGGAKMSSFGEFKNSIQNVAEVCSTVHGYQLETLSDADAPRVKEYLGQIFDNLVVMKSTAKLVGNSKVMHHLLPDLVPPIDREHTLQFFFGNKTLVSPNDRTIFLQCFDWFRDIAAAIGDKHTVFEGFNSSLPKTIDNAIMGYVMANLLGL